MKKFTKAIALVLALVIVVASFAACGNKADNTASDKKVKYIDISLTDEQYAFGVSKKDPELLKAVNEFIKEIKENGTLGKIIDEYFGEAQPQGIVSAKEDPSKDQLVVVTNAAFAPFEYKEGDNFLGIDMALAKALAEKLGKELVIKNVEFDAVLQQVEAGYADIAMAGLTINEERMKSVNFSDSYYVASQYLIVKGGDTKFDACKTADDVAKILNTFDSSVKIGVQRGTTGEFYCKGDADWGFAGFKTTCVAYDNAALAVQDMLNGNIQYVVIDKAPAMYLTNSFNK